MERGETLLGRPTTVRRRMRCQEFVNCGSSSNAVFPLCSLSRQNKQSQLSVADGPRASHPWCCKQWWTLGVINWRQSNYVDNTCDDSTSRGKNSEKSAKFRVSNKVPQASAVIFENTRIPLQHNVRA